jgi:hypothetical protein
MALNDFRHPLTRCRDFQDAMDNRQRFSKAKMTETPKVVPTALTSQESVTKQQFMSACEGTTSKGG